MRDMWERVGVDRKRVGILNVDSVPNEVVMYHAGQPLIGASALVETGKLAPFESTFSPREYDASGWWVAPMPDVVRLLAAFDSVQYLQDHLLHPDTRDLMWDDNVRRGWYHDEIDDPEPGFSAYRVISHSGILGTELPDGTSGAALVLRLPERKISIAVAHNGSDNLSRNVEGKELIEIAFRIFHQGTWPSLDLFGRAGIVGKIE